MNPSLFEIAAHVHGVVIGDESLQVLSLSPIDQIAPNSLVFADGTENIARAEHSEATAILVAPHVSSSKKPLIQVAEPFKAFLALLHYFHPTTPASAGIHPTAVIAPDVLLGKHVSIGAYVVIESGSQIGDHTVIKSHVHVGHQVSIGAHCTLHPHVTLYDNTRLGSQVVIHASTVIGSDGFGYTTDKGNHIKIPHVGYVVIEDDVEIGSNVSVDRATLGETRIGQGTKIDNFVQIAHSVKLGQHNLLCAFTGIAGSTTSGNHVIFAANVGVSDHVKIDDGVILGARAGVPPNKHLRKGNVYLGNPARPKEKAIEQELATTRIPLMRKNMKAMNERLNALSQRIEKQENQNV